MPRSGKNNERTEQVPRGRKKLTKIEPLHPQAEHPDKLYNDLAKFPSENPYPVLRIHKDGTVLYANKASEPLLKARSSGVGQPAPAQWRRLVKEVLVSGCVTREEVKDDGRVFAFQVTPITGSDYVNFYGVDITERKRAEEKLQEEHNLLRTLIDHMPDGVYIKDKEGRILGYNKSLAESWETRGKDNIIGKTDFDLFEPAKAQHYFDEEQKVIQTGQPIIDQESQCTDKSGIANFLLVTKVPLRDSAGNITGIVGIHRDITERKRAEQALRYQNEMQQTILDSIPVMVMLFDRKGHYKLVNRYGQSTLGWSFEEILQHKDIFAEFYPDPKYREYVLDYIKSASGTESWSDFKTRIRDGHVLDTSWINVPLSDGSIIGIGIDITERKKAEEVLRESEDKFKHVFDYSAIGKSITLMSGEMQANKALCEMLGYSEEELKVKKWQEITHPDDVEASQIAVDSILSGQKDSVQLFKRYIHKNGSVVWADVSTSLRRNNEGKPLYLITSVVNITERKRAEEALQTSEERFRLVIENAPFGYYRVGKDGLWQHVNPVWERMHGCSLKDIIGKPFEITQTREDVEKAQQHVKRALAGETITGEFSRITKQGTVKYHRFNIQPVRQGNEIVAIEGFINDITEQKRAEEILRESEDKFRHVFDYSSIGKSITLMSGEMQANKALCEMLGYSQEELKVKKWQDVTHPDDIKDTQKAVDSILSGQKDSVQLFKRYIHKNGSVVWADVSTSLRRDNKGKPLYLMTSVVNITERKQVEHKILEYQNHLKQLATRLTLTEERERRHIASEIHDEIGQTLAMVKIKLDTLRNSPPSEASAAEIKEISSSVEKVIQKIRTLTFELSNPLLYVLGLEAAVAEWLSEQVQEKHGIATEFQDDGKAKPLDDDVKMMLFRNVRELRTNCIKHAKASRVKVNIRRIDDSIEVVVEDNGVGFDPAEVRLMTGKRAKFGLFSIRESLENLGGHFEIESKPGAGCKAIMTAPLKDQSHKKEV